MVYYHNLNNNFKNICYVVLSQLTFLITKFVGVMVILFQISCKQQKKWNQLVPKHMHSWILNFKVFEGTGVLTCCFGSPSLSELAPDTDFEKTNSMNSTEFNFEKGFPSNFLIFRKICIFERDN